jgi:hypothetical protein
MNVLGGYGTTGTPASGQYKVIGFTGTTKDVTDITGQTGGEVQKNFYLGMIGGDYFNVNRFSVWQGGSERLTVQGYGATAGNVGIGTSSPSAKLHVKTSGADGIVLDQDTGSTNNSSRLFFNSTSGNWAIFNNSHNLNFQSGATAGATSGNYTDFTIATSGVICRRQLHISSDNLKVDSGYGIDFSSNNQHGAVTGASSTSEVLDDYEEGTWTPIISHNDGTGVIPLTVSQASYVKIGRLVHVRCYLTAINPAGNAGTSSPYYGIRGMPFSAAGYGSWQIVYASNGITSYGGYTSAASLYFLRASGSSPMGQAHTTGTVINSWGSNVVFMMSASYQTA